MTDAKRILREELKRNPTTIELNGYYFETTPVGIIISKDKITNDNVVRIEYLSFDSLKRKKVSLFDPLTGSTNEKTHFEAIVNKKIYKIQDAVDVKTPVKEAKRGYVKVDQHIELAVWEYLQKLPEEQEFGTKGHCFYNKKNYTTKTHELFEDVFDREPSGEMTNSIIKGWVSDKFKEFCELNIEQEKVDRCIQLVNKMPRNEREGVLLKIILSWSIAAYMKMDLHRLQIGVYPQLIIKGVTGSGKSTNTRILVAGLWNSDEYYSSDLKGREGARLADKDNNTLPKYFDEVESFGTLELAIKAAGTIPLIKISKGKEDGGMRHITKLFSFCVSSNNFSLSDEAQRSRLIIINYDIKEPFIISKDDVQYLTTNIKHLGKKITELLTTIDVSNIIKNTFTELINYDQRERGIVATIKVGEYVCNQLEILQDYTITAENILEQDSSRIRDEGRDILEAASQLLTGFTYRNFNTAHYGHENMPLKYTLNHPEKITQDVINEASRIGVYFTFAGTKIIITKQFLTSMSNELKRSYGRDIRLSTLKEFQERINKKDLSQVHSCLYEKDNHNTKKSKSITGIIVGMSDEEREKNQESFLDLLG